MFLHLLSTQDHAAAATEKAGTSIVFVWKGETLPETWWCTEQIMTVPEADGCDELVDYGGDVTLLMHKTVLQEEFPEFAGIKVHTADDHFKSIEQCIAAAAVPDFNSAGRRRSSWHRRSRRRRASESREAHHILQTGIASPIDGSWHCHPLAIGLRVLRPATGARI